MLLSFLSGRTRDLPPKWRGCFKCQFHHVPRLTWRGGRTNEIKSQIKSLLYRIPYKLWYVYIYIYIYIYMCNNYSPKAKLILLNYQDHWVCIYYINIYIYIYIYLYLYSIYTLSDLGIYHHLTNVTNLCLLAATETKRCYVTIKHWNLNFLQRCNLKVYSRCLWIFLSLKSPEEWAITKQACRDESVVFFLLPIYNIYIYIYIYIYILIRYIYWQDWYLTLPKFEKRSVLVAMGLLELPDLRHTLVDTGTTIVVC